MSTSRDSFSNGDKAAEQARLSELFKLLASRRPQSHAHSLSSVTPRPTDASTSTDRARGTGSASNDADATYADPISKQLSNLNAIDITHQRDTLLTGGTVTRPRRNTVATFPTSASTTIHAPLDATRPDPLDLTTGLPPRLSPVPQADDDMDAEQQDADEDTEADADDAKFPLSGSAAKKYPFTFKLMIYKLYKKEDWVKTIKEMLEKSKNEFKPLAEKEKDVVYAGAKAEEESMPPANKDGGAVRFKLSAPSPGPSSRQRRTSGVSVGASYTTHIRQRSMSSVGPSSGTTSGLYTSRPAAAYPRSPFPKSPKSPTPFSPTSPSFSLSANPSSPSASITEPGVRVLKKRCVGRRRSMSLSVPSPLGPFGASNENAEAASQQLHHQPTRISGTWVYNAAVSRSASERPAAATSSSLSKYLPDDPPPSPTGGRFPGQAHAPLGARNLNISSASGIASGQMMQAMGGVPTTPKMMMMSSTPSAPTMMMPLSPVPGGKERLVARRRAMTVGSADNGAPMVEQRTPAKRPLAA